MRGLGSVDKMRAALEKLQDLNPDMTVSLAITFLLVASSPGKSAREYGSMLDLGSSSISRHLLDLGRVSRKKHVPGLDLIEQEVNPEDRRANLYWLTSKGKSLLHQLETVLEGRAAK